MSANGQLTSGELAPAAGCIVGSFQGSGQLRKDAAAAWNAFNAEAVRTHGVHLTDNGPACAYRNLSYQWYFWNLYQHGGNLAAYPGSSNHGWGIATDTPPYVWAIMRAIGAKYGWGPCTDAPSEAWHRKWCGNWHGADPGAPGHHHNRYPTLKKGDRSHAVTRLQKHLKRWNIGLEPGKIDGDFGKHTHNDVVKFQLIHGLKGDGVVGHRTWARVRLVDHFLAEERLYLNHLRLAYAHRKRGHHPSKAENKQINRWRGQCAKEAHAIRRVAVNQHHGWKGNYRLVRFQQLRHAAGRSY